MIKLWSKSKRPDHATILKLWIQPPASNDTCSHHRCVGLWWKVLQVMYKLSCVKRSFCWQTAYWHFLFSVFVLCFMDVSCFSINMYTWVSFDTQDNECFDVDQWRHHQTDDSRSVWTHTNERLPWLCFFLLPITSPRGNMEWHGVERCALLSFCSIFSLISSEVWLHSPLYC